jgi:hypothetical protein
MPAKLKDIIENTKDIYMTDSAVVSLMDFERVLDELDVYAFANWKQGELVEGPTYEKYFITCTFMWPDKKMPDPTGGQRLLDYDCEVKFKKDVLLYPIKVKTPNDFKPGTKIPKIGKTPIWLVEITIPKQLMQEIHQGSMELEHDTIDVEDIQQSYEEGLDDEMYKADDEQQGQQNAAAAPAPTI